MIFRLKGVKALVDAFKLEYEEWRKKHPDIEEISWIEWKKKYALDTRREKERPRYTSSSKPPTKSKP